MQEVTSLFTNITEKLVINSLDRRSVNIFKFSKLPFDEIKEATKYLFNNMFFTFNDKIYKQEKGSPKGSKISPIFADFVMTDLENECLS